MTTSNKTSDTVESTTNRKHHIAVIGAGIAGIACARTLDRAGFRVSVFEKEDHPAGRMAHKITAHGSFDEGVQFFTVRDKRFELALNSTAPDVCRPWSATTLIEISEHGKKTKLPSSSESHWVAIPGMGSLVERWTQPLQSQSCYYSSTEVIAMERTPNTPEKWQLRCKHNAAGDRAYNGFDAIVLAIPAPEALKLLRGSQLQSPLLLPISQVVMEPCWTLMLSFPQASQPQLTTLGPQWNVARSQHHRIAWLARESSKPGRSMIERWTVHANADWSKRHQHDTPARVLAKLHKAFTELTGIHAQPAHMDVKLWPYARTVHPLGQSFAWDSQEQFGVCGDWCVGMRVEDAFISGLELALAINEQTS